VYDELVLWMLTAGTRVQAKAMKELEILMQDSGKRR
jgi:hypothetical protein